MSEYFEFETETSEDDTQISVYTNLTLAEQVAEEYDSLAAMEEGSPVAQALSVIEGIQALRIEDQDLHITREPDAEWHSIVADVTAVLKDFFL